MSGTISALSRTELSVQTKTAELKLSSDTTPAALKISFDTTLHVI